MFLEVLETTGRILQVIGVVVLFWAILRTREFLGGRPLRHIALRPFRRLWRRIFKKPPVTVNLQASLSAVTSMGVGRVVVKPDWSKLTADERLRRLQEMADRHEDELSQVSKSVRDESREREKALSQERVERQQLRADLEKRIREAAAAGLSREFAGTLLVFVGLLLTEVARYLA